MQHQLFTASSKRRLIAVPFYVCLLLSVFLGTGTNHPSAKTSTIPLLPESFLQLKGVDLASGLRASQFRLTEDPLTYAGTQGDVNTRSGSGLTVAPRATLTVTNLNDSGAGSLRQTVATAASGDTIVFQPGLSGTIVLTTGRLVIQDKSLTITGPVTQPGIVIDGNNSDRIATIAAMSSPLTITLSNLTFQRGVGGPGVGNGAGGIFQNSTSTTNTVTSTLTNCVFRQCMAPDPMTGAGAALYVQGALGVLAGSMTLNRCVFSGNSAGYEAGAIENIDSMVVCNQCTFSGNSAGALGGGISNTRSITQLNNCTLSGNVSGNQGGAINNQEGMVTLSNCTVSGNVASNTFPGAPVRGLGGGICNLTFSALPSRVMLQNCTIAGNISATGNGTNILNANGPTPAATGAVTVLFGNTIVAGGIPSVAPNFASSGPTASHTSLGYNICSDLTAYQFGVGTGDQPGTNPLLLPLEFNGGPTMTHLPALGSPAINTGNPNFTAPPMTDQRGGPRMLNGRLDIGAVETDYLVRGPVISTLAPLAGARGSSVTITGLNLNQATGITFNGVRASFTVDSPTQITATVPGTATTGVVQATSTAGTSIGPVFTVIRTK